MTLTLSGLFIMALATTAITVTLTKSSFFTGLRMSARKRLPKWLAKLFSCPYCATHWVALAVTAAYFSLDPFVLFLAAAAVVGLSAAFTGLVIWLLPFAPDQDLVEAHNAQTGK